MLECVPGGSRSKGDVLNRTEWPPGEYDSDVFGEGVLGQEPGKSSSKEEVDLGRTAPSTLSLLDLPPLHNPLLT